LLACKAKLATDYGQGFNNLDTMAAFCRCAGSF
jgi:hypothetical protein